MKKIEVSAQVEMTLNFNDRIYASSPSHAWFPNVAALQQQRYAQLDFTHVDQRLGTVEELRHLTTEAHRLGMYVIIDAWELREIFGGWRWLSSSWLYIYIYIRKCIN